MKNKTGVVGILLLLAITAAACQRQYEEINGDPPVVELREDADGYSMLVNNSPFFVKGARTLGTRFIDQVAEHGGNAIRIGYHTGNVDEKLEEAGRHGLYVLFGLPVRAERDGFDYDDESAVRNQHEQVLGIVERFRDHPAIMAWALGNELDHIPGNLPYNRKLWDALNDMARSIREIDPGRPVMTVIGTGMPEKLSDLMERAPYLDLLGINAYADIVDIPAWLREYGWNRPYMVTEWGPSGHWEVPSTRWGAVIEESSTQKAELYRKHYESVIAADPLCLGSFAFLWTANRMERTHTWYNMFHNGSKTEAVQVMQYLWTGRWPDVRAPRIRSITINGVTAFEHLTAEPGDRLQVHVDATAPSGQALEYSWELLPELGEFAAYAGQGEVKPDSVPGFILDRNDAGDQILIEAPLEAERTYRLFVYVHDDHNNVATANFPFYITQP